MTELTWRPTSLSMRNLAGFWAALTLAAGAVSLVRGGGEQRVATLVVTLLGILAGALVAFVWNGPKVRRALDVAEKPALRNWPPRRAERARAARTARHDAFRVACLGLAIGAAAGTAPVVGPAATAAGAAATVGTVLVRRIVRRYEVENDRLVLTASSATDRRRVMLGIVSSPA